MLSDVPSTPVARCVMRSHDTIDVAYDVAHMLPIGTALFDKWLCYTHVSADLAGRYGLPPDQLIGCALREAQPGLADTVEPLLQHVLESGQPCTQAVIVDLAPGPPQHWLLVLFPIPHHDDGSDGVGMTVLDQAGAPAPPAQRWLAAALDEERVARANAELMAARLARLQLVLGALATTHTLEQAIEVVIEQGVPAIGASVGALALLNETGTLLEIVRAVGTNRQAIETMHYVGLDQPNPLADAIHSAAPIWIASQADYRAKYRAITPQTLVLMPSHALVSLPLRADQQVIGALGLWFDSDRAFSPQEQEAIGTLAQHCAQALERARLYEAAEQARARAEQAQARAAFLDSVGTLLASSLDYNQTIGQLVRLIVPELADWCLIDLADASGQLQPLELAHRDPTKEQMARTMRVRYPLRNGDGLLRMVLLGDRVLLPSLQDDHLRMLMRSESHLIFLRELGLRSLIGVPLVLHDGVRGTMLLASAESGRRFGPDDLALAEELARRVSLAIDHTRLYQASQSAVARKDEALALLDTLVASAPVGVAFLDRQLRFQIVNAIMAGFLGQPAPTLPGRVLGEALPALAPIIEPLLVRVLESGAPLVDLEVQVEPFGAPGECRAWLLNSYPVHATAGRTPGVGLLAVDITERKRAEHEQLTLERKLLETQKLESMGVLAGGIAHDFNNLLATILGNVDLALLDLPQNAPARESVQQIKIAGRRAAELTQQMLAYSGKGRFVVDLLDLNNQIMEMSRLLRASIPKSIDIRYRLAPRLPPIEADATQIRQALMNLILNAAEAIGDQVGRVTVSTGLRMVDRDYLAGCYLAPDLPSGEYVFLQIDDTGVGIDTSMLGKIFEPFFSTKFVGRGLGLPAVLGIVRGHRGAVRVESVAEQGCQFTVLLPCAERLIEATISVGATPPDQQLSGTVLVIDDEEGVRIIVRRLLEREGLTVLTAADGYSGMELFRSYADSITCVLLDLTMPRLGGDASFRALRQIKPDVPVVLMSGYSEDEAIRRFGEYGMAGFIHKPFTPNDIRSVLRRLQQRPR